MEGGLVFFTSCCFGASRYISALGEEVGVSKSRLLSEYGSGM